MTTRRALIVDDSKTAQVRLKKMLSRFGLEVDIAFSAEEALGMLSYRNPAVIFMDHHMEGMDGFEALKIIKANPNTAMIPVIMYTAQKGDVYVGQARALGALDILSKEIFKPSNLERVLRTLSLVNGDEDESEDPQVTAEEKAKVEPAVAVEEVAEAIQSSVEMKAESDTQEIPSIKDETIEIRSRSGGLDREGLYQVQAQIARLFEIHIADVRSQITQNTKYTVKQLSEEIDKAFNKEVTVDDVPLSVVKAEADAERSRIGLVSNSLLLLILLGLGIMAFQQWNLETEIQNIDKKYEALANTKTMESDLVNVIAENVFRSQQEQELLNDGKFPLLDTLSWALSNSITFGYNEIPLGETQTRTVATLVAQLYRAQFRGVITLNVNYGNWCLERTPQGGYALAEPNMPVSECVFYEDIFNETAPSDYLSVSFVNLEQTAEPIVRGEIELEVLPLGFESQVKEYPRDKTSATAEEWNKAAQMNSRISLTFVQA
ncbi:response regulator [Teredinibacter sp. KSP-S5-2]|uniref:response regulator n=1 Tax=Teredinibacter sp. KSP-S5-2 TaxID=3034506 RepID=UPI00293481F7|nr:response regulator [Teredinibacter sp. KSP-S5-2]WNO09670.1 response regulator [Teredinibacter sp. KSP-S5-2]